MVLESSAPQHAASVVSCQSALLCPGLLFPRNSLINTLTLHLTVCNHNTGFGGVVVVVVVISVSILLLEWHLGRRGLCP